MIEIVKYSNRKFYDTSLKDYISLDKIVEKFRANEPFCIVTYKTGTDITARTLVLAIALRGTDEDIKKLLYNSITL